MNDLEKRAHDLAVILCQQELSKKNISCSSDAVFDFVKTYEHYYSYVLNSFESVK
ncbi:MAG: hypothetical protein HFG29_10165 [Eubacterium sp.]|nr:hypothetical protein [Eubacterium sp.]